MKRAVVVGDGKLHVESVLGALTASGFEAVAVASTAEARAQVEAGAQVAVVGASGVPWTGERSAPIATMPSAARRGFLLVLVETGFVTGEGIRAFLLGADLVAATADAGRLGELAAGALVAKRQLVAALDPVAAGRLGG